MTEGWRRAKPGSSISAPARDSYVIDVQSSLSAAAWDLSLGPTRHAYFSVRVAESIAVTAGGKLQDDRGHSGGAGISGHGARWIDYSGPVGGGHQAGIAVFPDPRDHADPYWFVADWGVVTVGPFRTERRDIRQGETMLLRYRVLVHDGDAASAGGRPPLRRISAGPSGGLADAALRDDRLASRPCAERRDC